MSYVSEGLGSNYRGGYATSGSFDHDDLRVATSTFQNYVGGTVLLVFLVFFVFIILSGITFLLMSYARYLSRRRPTGGFYDPPPMILRFPASRNAPPTYSTLTSQKSGATTATGGDRDYASISLRHQQIPSAMSQHSTTATSTML